MASKIEMIQGSSIDEDIVDQDRTAAEDYHKVLVCLDSNHTPDHVLAELYAYAPLVPSGSYCIVFDTIVEDIPPIKFTDRPWGPGDNPKTAVHDWLKVNPDFEIDKSIDHKLQISVAPDGFLRRR